MVPGISGQRIGCWIAAAAIGLGLLSPAWGQARGEAMADNIVVLSGDHADQQFISGGTIRIDATVSDDLFVAGGDVELRDASAESLLVTGGDVRLLGITARDVFVAGGNVSVSGGILDDLVGAAGMLRIRQAADILDDARLAGGTVEMAGRIGGDLYVSGGRIEMSGEVMGNVFVAGRHVVLSPGARIHGDLRYVGDRLPEIAESAVIGGAISPVAGSLFHFEEPGTSDWGLGTVIAWLIGAVGLVVAGTVMQILFPTLVAACVDRVGRRRLFSLALGLVLAAGAPILALMLVVTVIGLPIGLIVLSAYPVLLAIAALISGAAIGHRIARLSRRHDTGHPLPLDGATLGWTAMGLLVLAVLPTVPYVGFLIALAVVFAGLGGLTAEIWNRLQAGRTASQGVGAKGSTRSR